MSNCTTCASPVVENVANGCTAYTCMTRCAACGHIGDVHRDWYAPGFCRGCPETLESRHGFKAAVPVASR